MRPTFSIILFTVLSGAGYGLLFLLGVGLATGVSSLAPPLGELAGIAYLTSDPRAAIGWPLAAGTLLSIAGLLASVAHLGKPLRAWRAFSQWRSSWLSREGIAALATFIPVVAIAWLLQASALGEARGALRLCGALLAIGSFGTVYCTAHIYSCLKPIRAWYNPFVVPGYALLGLYSGALWAGAIMHGAAFGPRADALAKIVVAACAVVIAPACAYLKWRYWRWLDAAPAVSAAMATGLDRLGAVRSFEQPHTEENYLSHEMGFVLARAHARRLRAIALWLILLAPVSMLPLVLTGAAGAWIPLLAGMGGVLVERWLFFAEAKHAVMAYYQR